MLPYACWGSFAWSRSVARVDPVPGSVRLSFQSWPAPAARRWSAAAIAIQAAITGQRKRTQARPNP